MRGSRPFHGGRGSVDYDDAEFFDGDPRIAPGLPRPIGWRVRDGDGSQAYDKFGPLDTDWVPIGQTATPATPSGPSLPGALCFDFSYGFGTTATDDLLPNPGIKTFWLTPATDADHATVNQVREWEIGGTAGFVALDVYVSECTLNDTGTASIGRLIVTVNGVDTAALVTMFDGFTGRLQSVASVAVVDGDRVGLRWLSDVNFSTGQLQATAMVCLSVASPTLPPVLPGLGLLGLWETDPAICVITKDGVDRISSVTDGTSNGRTMLQAVGARQPLYVAGAFNSYPGIEFGAAMDRILEYSADNLGLADGGPRTVMCVCEPAGAAGGSLAVFKRATNYFGMELWTHGGRQDFYGNGQFPTPADISAVVPVDYGGNRIVVLWIWDGVTMVCRVQGVPIAVTPTTIGDETSVAPGLTLGNNNGVFGDRGFIGRGALWAVWDHALSAADVTSAEAYSVKYL